MPSFPLPDDDEDDDDGSHGLAIEAKWATVQSLWGGNQNMSAGRWGTRIGGTGNTVAGIGTSIASHAGTAGIAGKVGLGAAAGALTVGTGGLAVAAGAGVMQLGSMVLAAKSASKTWDHLKALGALQGRHFACTALPGANGGAKDHAAIQSNIIPYIINKKSAKLVKKGAGAVGLGALTGLFGVGKFLYKSARGTQGKRRSFYAFVVARHMITHDCKLCEALVSELLSPGDYQRLRTMNSEDASGWLARKMKST